MSLFYAIFLPDRVVLFFRIIFDFSSVRSIIGNFTKSEMKSVKCAKIVSFFEL